MPQRLLAATGQLTEQFVKLTDRQAVQIGQQIGAELRRAVELVGWIGSAGIGNHPPLQGSMGSGRCGWRGRPGGARLGRPAPRPTAGRVQGGERSSPPAAPGASRLSALSSTTVW
jgi:hypothetical protein